MLLDIIPIDQANEYEEILEKDGKQWKLKTKVLNDMYASITGNKIEACIARNWIGFETSFKDDTNNLAYHQTAQWIL